MSISVRGVRADVKRKETPGFEKPLKEFKELSSKAMAESQGAKIAEQEALRKEASAQRERQDKKAKAERERLLEMSEKVKSPKESTMYDSHYGMVNDYAAHLSDPEVIKKFAESPEGEAEFNSLVDRLLSMTSDFENYYTQTYGTPSDTLEDPTFMASSVRDVEGKYDFDDRRVDTDHKEMMERLTKLDTVSHATVDFENGQPVFKDENGNVVDHMNLDMAVFQADVQERPPTSGAEVVAKSYSPEVMKSEEDVRAYMEEILQEEAVLDDAGRAYVESQRSKNPDYARTKNDVLGKSYELKAVKEAYINDAIEAWKKMQSPEEEEDTSGIAEEKPVESPGELVESDIQIYEEEPMGTDSGYGTGGGKYRFSDQIPSVDIGGIQRKMTSMTFDPEDLSLNIVMDFSEKEEGKSYPGFSLTIPTTPDGKLENSAMLEEIIYQVDEKFGQGKFEEIYGQVKNSSMKPWWYPE